MCPARFHHLFLDYLSKKWQSALQQLCPKVDALRHSSALNIVSVPISGFFLLCDSSTGVLNPLVPESIQRKVFDNIHKISHPGKRASRRLVSRRFVWEFLSKDVNLWSESCLDCQQSKIQSHVKAPVLQIPVPSRRFSHIHVVLVGPLPQSQGFSYLFTIIDRTSRWPEAIPILQTTAVECAKGFAPFLDPCFWSSCSYYKRQRCSVYKFNLVFSVQVSRNYSLSNYIFSSSIHWNCGKIS